MPSGPTLKMLGSHECQYTITWDPYELTCLVMPSSVSASRFLTTTDPSSWDDCDVGGRQDSQIVRDETCQNLTESSLNMLQLLNLLSAIGYMFFVLFGQLFKNN